jgi:Na+/H+ antiporter NhaD/arsenite permease-like protein
MSTSNLTHTLPAILALAVFVLTYVLVLTEEVTQLRKSKSVVVAAGLVWILVAIAWARAGIPDVDHRLREAVLEFAELFLFLLAAMTFVNTLLERRVFDALRDWLLNRGYSRRALFWITGAMAFTLSPVLDNLTTALVLGAVAIALGQGDKRYISMCCINIVVAANAGGAFSPFGDVTTLMVWQEGKIPFFGFFTLFLPALVNWLVPAAIMSVAVSAGSPARVGAGVTMKPHALSVTMLFAATIVGTVSLHQFLHLPPFLGMMTGLGLLAVLGYYIRRQELAPVEQSVAATAVPSGLKPAVRPFDIFISMKRVEWDTLLFFYGIMLCIGGLGALGYLAVASQASYGHLSATTTHVLVGIASAVIDNIPIMFAVLSAAPQLSEGQWLLVTLTAGVGGSILSIGSAAGVALMGQAHGVYTFGSHLRWAWAVALGYAASIAVHLWINAALF